MEQEDPTTYDELEDEGNRSEDEYPVERIEDERTSAAGGTEYLVKWVGYCKSTWEPLHSIEETKAFDLWVNRVAAHVVEAHAASNGGDSLNWHQAMRSEHAPEYKLAADKEYASLIENGTWKLVKHPPHTSVVGSTWVFRQKVNPDGTFNKFKARACAQGFSQRYDIDYTETYSPTIPLAILRLVLAICTARNIPIHSMDAITAFLNAQVDRTIYMEQLVGFEDARLPKKDYVYLLQKSLYGLKQSPLLWFKTVGDAFTAMGFRSLDNCPCLFIKHCANQSANDDFPSRIEDIADWEKVVIVLVYVDDFLIRT